MRRIVGMIGTGLFAAIFLFMAPAALALQYGDLTYTSDGTSITITDCSTSATSVVIPATIDGLPVTSIGDYAFSWCTSLAGITIPDGVTSIGDDAFSYCTSLTSISIPNNVTFIGDSAFSWCTNLAGITIPNGVTSISDYAFQGCDGLVSISIPDGVTSIGDGAISYCSLSSITIPNSVTSIGDEAFRYCMSLVRFDVDAANPSFSSLDGVLFNKDQSMLIQYPPGKTANSYTIPASVTSIGNSAFFWCRSLAGIAVNGDHPSFSSLDGVLFNKDQSMLIQYPAGKTADSYTIPNSVTSIGFAAFYDCRPLANITIPNSVTSIGDYAFCYCHRLASITIPNSVTSIGDSAFYSCNLLTSLSIPDSVTSIGDSAFYYCSRLTSVEIGNGLTSIGSYAFRNCTSLTSVEIGNGLTSIGSYAFRSCTNLTSVVLGNSVISIGNSAFSYCTSLTSLSIPDSVTSIDRYTFYECTSLASVYFEGDAPSVESYAFSGADNATIYYLPGTNGWETTFGGRPTLLWNPTIDVGEGFGVGNDGFGFNISGTADIPVLIEACTNLAEGIWIPLQTNTLSSGTLQFIDPEWTDHPNRIYRISGP